MSEASTQPSWDKLPHDAQGFFELEDGYDRKDLKRAYNRLLKQFKPEKFPQEFQQIRQAFELLDNHLRYGTQAAAAAIVQQYAWQVPQPAAAESAAPAGPAAPQDTSPASPPRPRPQERPLHERVARERPEKLYAELKALNPKRPYHYFALAVLSDTLEGAGSLDFIKWLLAGLKRNPHDPALLQLVYAAFRGPIAPADLPGLLLGTSTVVNDDRFYALTEPLWDELLRSTPFETFRKLLKKCEGNLSDFQLARKLTFYVHILKTALWLADPNWLDAAFAFLDTHHQEIPPDLEYDVEMLDRLREYVAHREEFLAGHPLRAMIDRTIRTYCTGTPLEAEQSFVACQLKLAGSGADVLAAFPLFDESPGTDAFASVWRLLGIEFSDRIPSTDDRPPQKFALRQALQDLEAKTNRSALGHSWNWTGWFYGVGRFLLYPVLYIILLWAVVFSFDKNSAARVPLILVCIAVAWVSAWSFNKYVAEGLWTRWCFRQGRKCYERIWRRELQQILGRTMLPYRDLLDRIAHVNDSTGELEYRDWIVAFASRDFALMIYSYAQVFVA